MMRESGLSIPNLITIFRILLVPVTIWLIVTGEYFPAFVAFIVAGLSDGIDGLVAKHFNQATELGAYLDPLADKFLLVSIYLSMGFLSLLPPLLVIIVTSRDIMIISAVLLSWLIGRPVKIHPLWISKLNTAFQIAFAGFVLACLGLELNINHSMLIGSVIVGGLTIMSGVSYILQWFRHMANGNGANGNGYEHQDATKNKQGGS